MLASGNRGQAARVARRCWRRSASNSCRSREFGIAAAAGDRHSRSSRTRCSRRATRRELARLAGDRRRFRARSRCARRRARAVLGALRRRATRATTDNLRKLLRRARGRAGGASARRAIAACIVFMRSARRSVAADRPGELGRPHRRSAARQRRLWLRPDLRAAAARASPRRSCRPRKRIS